MDGVGNVGVAGDGGQGAQPIAPTTGRGGWLLLKQGGLAVLWLATTLGAAVVGYFSTSYLDRSHPEITFVDIRLSPEFNASLEPAEKQIKLPPEDTFEQELADNPWMRNVDFSSGNPKKIAETLQDNIDIAQDLLREMSEFRSEYSSFMALVEGPRTKSAAEAFFIKWQRLDGYIYGALKGDIKRGSFNAPPPKDYEGVPAYLRFNRVNMDGKQWERVAMVGGLRFSVFALEDDSSSDGVLHEITLALAHFDQPVLRAYLDVVRRDAERIGDVQLVNEHLQTYAAGLSRWVVIGLVTNSGSKPISLFPEAVLYINTENASGFTENISVHLAFRDTGGKPQPITIKGGETQSLSLTSDRLVIKGPRWKELLGLFRDASRTSFVVLHAEGDPWLKGTALMSSLHAFGASTSKEPMSADLVKARFIAGK